MDPLLIALAVAGLLVGATGTWSPCGFSMIETIGPTGHVGGPATTAYASPAAMSKAHRPNRIPSLMDATSNQPAARRNCSIHTDVEEIVRQAQPR